jgi:hypothetical protein
MHAALQRDNGGEDRLANFVSTHASEIWSAIVGAIAGATVSIPITIRVTRNSMSGSATRSNQSGARARGDVVGRDKIDR